MPSLRRSTAPSPRLLARWRAAWLPRRAASPVSEEWGMECALPWLQPQAAAVQPRP